MLPRRHGLVSVFQGDGQYPGDGGHLLQKLWESFPWKEVKGCPGRYVSNSDILRRTSPEALRSAFGQGCPVENFSVPGKDEVATVRFHGGGGLITYLKPTDPLPARDGTFNEGGVVFVHTLNTESGLLRKI